MSESVYKIREKTVILFGPTNSLSQSIGTILIEHGADVAFIDEKASELHRFIASLNEMRHVHNHYGRAAAVDSPMESAKDAKEAISRAAELFGSLDILIDTSFLGRDTVGDHTKSELITNEALEFLTGRGKGRIIYLSLESVLCERDATEELTSQNKRLDQFVLKKVKELDNKLITLNQVAVGYTDELLLKLYPDLTIQAAFEKESKINSMAKMTEPVDIANIVTFLASPISHSLNGQKLHCSYGLNLQI